MFAVLDPRFEGPNRFEWRLAGADRSQDLEALNHLASQLFTGGFKARIGILVARDTEPLRAIVDGATGRTEVLGRRFDSTDAEAVVIVDDAALSEIGAGSLAPFMALRSNRLRFTGSYTTLLAALTILACASEAIPAPCEGAT